MKSALFILLTVFATSAQIQMNITESKRYQTIDGLGGFALDITNQTTLDKILGDLGASIIRINNGDAEQNDAYWVSLINQIKTRSAALNEQMPKIISTTWSPPASYKLNGSVSGTDPEVNKFDPQYYSEYATFISNFLKKIKSQTGIDIYSVSLQNEPMFAEPYWSCVYTAAEYHDMIKACAPLIKAQVPTIKFFGAENMLSDGNAYVYPTLKDTATNKFIDAIAYHGYINGITPMPTSTGANLWKTANSFANSQNKRLWMTETSGYSNDWAGAMTLAQNIYLSLKYGKLNAWVWWTFSGGSDGYNLMSGSTPTDRYYTSKNFYRWIRPGAVMVDIGDTFASAQQVFATAFTHAANKTITIVLLNMSSSTQQIQLNGIASTNFQKFTTSSSKHCISDGTASSSNTISLDASSVTTLYATNYATSVSQPATSSAKMPLSGECNLTVYALDGKKIGSMAIGSGAINEARTVLSQSSWTSMKGTYIATLSRGDNATSFHFIRN